MNASSRLLGLAALSVLVGPASADVVVMGENSDDSSTGNSHSKGNVVSVDSPVACAGIGLYLENVPANTNLLWAVYESDAFDGTFDKVFEITQQVAGGTGYFDSPVMDVPLSVGKFYWLGGFWDQPVTYFYSNTMPGGPLYFDYGSGTMTYHARKGAFSTFPGPPQFSGSPSTNAPYWQRYDLGGEPGVPYCFGNPVSGNPCPCGNDNDGTVPLGGCQHDDSAAGAVLSGSGTASVTEDTLALLGDRGPISNSTLFFQANNNLEGGSAFLGDGIRCAGGGLIRLKVKATDATGHADSSPAVISARSAAFGHPISAGETLYYQWWFRDVGGSPCSTESNTSNGYMITWAP